MRTRHALLALVACFSIAAPPAGAATITIVNIDGPGEGFNDATPATPVGGNPGTTLGQQRLNVFQHAAQVWGNILPSPVEIRIEAKFDPLSCTATSAVLGFASAIAAEANFPNAPFPNTFYSIALANKLAGEDRDPAENDIGATFNSALDNGSASCLGGARWYYGFDGNEGTNVDLLVVLLHEFAHGLGFQTFTSLSTGQFNGGQPDIYARNILDKTLGLHWHQMSAAQRVASAVNTGNVVWDGPATTAAAPHVLGRRPTLAVTSPPAIAGNYVVGLADFGPQLTTGGVTGQVALVDDGSAPTSDACSPIVNGGAVSGKIALIDRGTCTFVSKAQAAEAVGAIGVIIVNNVGGPPPAMAGADPGIGIPVVSVSMTDGNAIRAQLGTGVTASLKLDSTQFAGADPQGRVLLFTPNPLQQGSSISHWDISCFPNTLMEPAINRDLQPDQVDLTFYHFADIGWDPITPVALADLVVAASNAEGVELRWRAEGGEFLGFDVMRAPMHPDTGDFELRNPGHPVPGNGPWVFVDRDVVPGETYAYRIVGHLSGGETAIAGPVIVTIETPARIDLAVWPNPVRDAATLQVDLPRGGGVQLRIYDLAGRRVRELQRVAALPGRYTTRWDGRDDAGRLVASGVYLARLESSAGTLVRRMAVLR